MFSKKLQIFVVATLIYVSSIQHSAAAQTTPFKPVKNSVTMFDFENFFRFFISKKEALAKNEFESTADWTKRINGSFDSNKIYYFPVSGEFTSAGNTKYTYDADTHKLSGYAGELANIDTYDIKEYLDKYQKPSESYCPVIINRGYYGRGNYVGENAFGSKIKVDHYNVDYYVINVLNANNLSHSVFDKSSGQITLSLYTSSTAAKSLSGKLYMLIGVSLEGYLRSKSLCIGTHKPTIDDPRDTSDIVYMIDGYVHDIVLVRPGSNTVLAEYKVSSTPPTASAIGSK